MARFAIPEGWTVQAYRFALDPIPAQEEALRSHAGARNFAYNTMLAAVKANLDQRAAEKTYGLDEDELTPCLGWSMRSLRNEWNRIKHVVAVRADGTPWWTENSKEAYASGCQSLANALENWSQSRKGRRNGPRMGFPRLRSKRRSPRTSPSLPGRCVSNPTATTWCCPGSAVFARMNRRVSWPAGWRPARRGSCRPPCVSLVGVGSAHFR
jgi:hypothetical protein